MKVLTLSQEDLHAHTHALTQQIMQKEMKINLLIGIATGGVFISRPLHEILKKNGWNGQYAEIKLSRPSTNLKKKWKFKSLLTKLPYAILDILRILEVSLFESLKSKNYDSTKESTISLPTSLINSIKKADSLLLIDDAIDTGTTILAIKHVIKDLNPNIDIKIGVLTVTHKAPYIQPDYTLYRGVLLRCPWAEDYKGGDKLA